MKNKKKTSLNFGELLFRFLIGGGTVVLSYLIAVYSPSKALGGIFAAFPGVMGAAIILAGLKEGDAFASEVAFGAISGMMGCAACVASAIILIQKFHSWPLGIAISILIWFMASMLCHFLFARFMNKVKSVKNESSQ